MPIFVLDVEEVYKNSGQIEVEADTIEDAIDKYETQATVDQIDRNTAELVDWKVTKAVKSGDISHGESCDCEDCEGTLRWTECRLCGRQRCNGMCEGDYSPDVEPDLTYTPSE